MQLTRLDRWLKDTYVHEMHVYTLRRPEIVPPGVKVVDLPEGPGKKYRFQFIARRNADAELLIQELKTHNQMFTTRVVNRSAWWVPLIAPEGKSVTWFCIWVILAGFGLFTLTSALRSIWSNDEFRKNFYDAIEVLKG